MLFHLQHPVTCVGLTCKARLLGVISCLEEMLTLDFNIFLFKISQSKKKKSYVYNNKYKFEGLSLNFYISTN